MKLLGWLLIGFGVFAIFVAISGTGSVAVAINSIIAGFVLLCLDDMHAEQKRTREQLQKSLEAIRQAIQMEAEQDRAWLAAAATSLESLDKKTYDKIGA